jgi:hypothetical protein
MSQIGLVLGLTRKCRTALKRCRATESLWNKWLVSCKSDVAVVMRRPSSDRKEAALVSSGPCVSVSMAMGTNS